MPGPKLNKAFPGAALQPESGMTNALATGGMTPQPINRLMPQTAQLGGDALASGSLPAPAQPVAVQGPPPPSPVPASPDAVVGAMQAAPVSQIVPFAKQAAPTSREQIKLARRMTAAVRDITELLKFPIITDADVSAVEKKARRSGDHEGATIDQFLSRLPPAANQARRRAFLERERAVLAKQIAAVHIAAGDAGTDLAGLITSGARRI